MSKLDYLKGKNPIRVVIEPDGISKEEKVEGRFATYKGFPKKKRKNQKAIA